MTTTLLLALTALLWGISPILEKVGLGKTDPLTAVSIRTFVVSAILLIFLAATGRLREVFTAGARPWAIFAVSGLLAGFLGMWTYFGALKMGATSRVVPIAATYPMITAILSILILKEGVTPLRILGTLTIIVGVWMVK